MVHVIVIVLDRVGVRHVDALEVLVRVQTHIVNQVLVLVLQAGDLVESTVGTLSLNLFFVLESAQLLVQLEILRDSYCLDVGIETHVLFLQAVHVSVQHLVVG